MYNIIYIKTNGTLLLQYCDTPSYEALFVFCNIGVYLTLNRSL